MLIFRKALVVIGLLAAMMALSGCQTLSRFFSPGERPVAQAPSAPLQADITKHEFDLAEGQAMVGEIAAVETRENDTLPDVGRHFGLGYNDITAANPGVSAWTPRPNTRVLLPLQFILPDAPRKGIVLNVANMRLFYYPKKERDKVYSYPVGVGMCHLPLSANTPRKAIACPAWCVRARTTPWAITPCGSRLAVT
jgi:L,D-transpeptidase ErfK/SrfK